MEIKNQRISTTAGREILRGLKRGADKLRDAVAPTLGPEGRLVAYFNPDGEVTLTKDGANAAVHVKSDDPAEETAIQVIRQASRKTAEEAGDGSTTTVLIAAELLSSCIDASEGKYTISQLKEMMRNAVQSIRTELSRKNGSRRDMTAFPYSFKADATMLKNVAAVSCNGDPSVTEPISEAIDFSGDEGEIRYVKDVDADETKVEKTDGCSYPYGLAGNAFLPHDGSRTLVLGDCLVLLKYGEVKKMQEIRGALSYAKKNGRHLAIFATGFSSSVLNELYYNLKDTWIAPINVSGSFANAHDVMLDLEAITGGKTVADDAASKAVSEEDGSAERMEEILGSVQELKANICSVTMKSGREEERRERACRLRKEEKEADRITGKVLRQRIASLTGRTSVIKVGGLTDAERDERYDRVEDAVLALRSAAEEGVSPGGGWAYYRLSLLPECGQIMRAALGAPLRTLCLNSELRYEDMIEEYDNDICMTYDFRKKKLTNIIDFMDGKEEAQVDTTKTVRLAIENAVSAVIMLMSTHTVLT